MSIALTTLVLFSGLLFFLALGLPVIFSLGLISVGVTYTINGSYALYMLATTAYQQITNPTLVTIPLFIIMGNFLVHSGISERLFQGLSYWLSGIRGGLALVSIAVCVALAMCGGFGPGILTMGLVAVPAMLKRNYDKSATLGSVMAGGVLAIVIPPSIIMIIFAYIARISVGKLFFGGLVPGMLLAAMYAGYILIRGHLNPDLFPKAEEEVTWAMRFAALREMALPILLVLAVLGSIFFGIATPTEAAAIGAIGALIICILYRKLTWQVLMDSCVGTMKITGMALWILIAATFFGVVYSDAGAQDMVMSFVQNLHVNRWFILLGIQAILTLFGMFMDDYAVVTICAPIFLPLAKLLGFDQIWFSILFILNMQVAYLSPPFGWALIMMKGVAPAGVSTRDIWRSVPPFVIMQLLVLILVMLFPALATWLPNIVF